MHFYAWKNGLKTGMYYLRSRPAVDAIKFTLNVEELLKATDCKDTSEVLKAINKLEHLDDEELKKRNSSISISEKDTKEISLVKNSDSLKYFKKEEEEGCINCSG